MINLEWILDNEMIYIKSPECGLAQEYMLNKGNDYYIIQKIHEEE